MKIPDITVDKRTCCLLNSEFFCNTWFGDKNYLAHLRSYVPPSYSFKFARCWHLLIVRTLALPLRFSISYPSGRSFHVTRNRQQIILVGCVINDRTTSGRVQLWHFFSTLAVLLPRYIRYYSIRNAGNTLVPTCSTNCHDHNQSKYKHQDVP